MHYLLLAEPKVYFVRVFYCMPSICQCQVMLTGNEPRKSQNKWDEIGPKRHCFIIKAVLSHITLEIFELGCSRGWGKSVIAIRGALKATETGNWRIRHDTHTFFFSFPLKLQVTQSLGPEALISNPILHSSMDDAFARSIPEVISYCLSPFLLLLKTLNLILTAESKSGSKHSLCF